MRNFALKAPGVKRRNDVLLASRGAGAADRVQRHDHAPPPVRVRVVADELGEERQERAGRDGERRRDGAVRGCVAAVAYRSRRAAGPAVARDGAGLGTRREREGAGGNRVSAMVAVLPTDEPDARRRLEAMKGEMSIAKSEHGALPASLLQDFAQVHTAVGARHREPRRPARARLMDRVGLPFNVVISNVPGRSSRSIRAAPAWRASTRSRRFSTVSDST